ncbi:hypothetical protein Sango_2575100 [Sesamum angolense]|uniref:Uncharacterized protein n=1 Tax=Sesamum angolense TaxID=2727404 RepID=A0AAE1W597_9LAMI|nr:hypothetical protein Sango_2575100 [Sesamum angolense]
MDQSTKGLPTPASAARTGVGKNSVGRRTGYLMSSGSHCMHRSHRNDQGATGGYRSRARQGSKEVVRRALTPPCQKPRWRWWNFRPTLSRLSNMSTA